MSEHTPGPWTSASGSVWKGDPFADPEGAYKIGGADRDEPRTLPVERDDNVRLMAAAPSLLTALQNLVDDFDRSVITTEPMLIAAREAIEAAT